jgi:hypothetical protein
VNASKSEPQLAIDLPPATPERILIRVAIEAYLATCHMKPRERGRAFFEFGSKLLMNEKSVAALFPIRTRDSRDRLDVVRLQACAIWSEWAPTFMARLMAAP